MTTQPPWLEMLAPWCEPLRGLVALEDKPHAAQQTRFLLRTFHWIRVSLRPPPSPSTVNDDDGEDDDRQLKRHRQTFQLLALLAHVDIHAFRKVLSACWGFASESAESAVHAGGEQDEHELDGGMEDDDDEQVCARFAFQFDGDSIAESVRWPEMLCSQLFAPLATANSEGDDDGDADGEEGAYRRIFTMMLAERSENSEVVVVPVCLEFNPLGIGYCDLVEFLLSVVRIVRTLRDYDLQRQATSSIPDVNQSRNERAVAFKLEAVKLHLYSFEITSEVAGILTTLVQLGVTISNLAIRLRESDISEGWCSRAAQGALFQALAGVRQDAQAVSSAVDCVTIQGPSVGVDQFAALSSALAVSKHVSTLNFFSVFDDASRANRIDKWKWLAYALFSCESAISVGKLGINGQKMLLEDVEAMIAVIQSSNPVRQLLSPDIAYSTTTVHTLTGGDESIAHLSKGTLVRLAPLDENDDWGLDDTLVLNQDVQVPVMVDDADDTSSEWLAVLVPGFGDCWVDRSAVSKITPRVVDHNNPVATRSRTTTIHQVSSFAISFDMDEDGGFAALRRLLSVIGGPLHSLEIFQAYGFTFECLADVLHFCPQLRNLYIEGIKLSTSDIDALIKLYGTQGCVLSSLTFEDYQVSNKSITRIVQALADPSSKRIARTIRELCIGESTEEITLDEANIQALLAMLHVNKTLLYLELHLPAPLYAKYSGAFMEHNNRYLPVEKQKLPLRSRLALLSVSSVSRFNQLRRVDECVLSLVFDFAAGASTRRVTVRETFVLF